MNQSHQGAPDFLRVRGVAFAYADEPLFGALDLTVAPGVTLVAGERGKTTLLRVLAGDLEVQAGWLAVRGVRLDQDPGLYRSQVFWIGPDTEIHDQRTPRELFRYLSGEYPGMDAVQADAMAERLGLGPHIDKAIYMLSSGSRRKVWMSAGFASGAAVVLVDDLFAALDRPSVQTLTQVLASEAGRDDRAWLVAHYEPPPGVALRATIDVDRLIAG